MRRTARLGVMCILLLAARAGSAATCNTVADGNWSNAGIWSCGSVPGPADTAVVFHQVALNVPASVASLQLVSGFINGANPLDVSAVTGGISLSFARKRPRLGDPSFVLQQPCWR